MEIKFLDLYKQYCDIKEEIDAAIQSVIKDTAFIRGPYARAFEKEFAAYQNAEYCVGVGNCTDGLEIAIEALHLKQGSEILVPANSFIASAEAVTRAGHKVIFCDCDPDDYTISIESVKDTLNKKTSAIMAVHLYGHPCDMDALSDIAREHSLKIIEDSAQAHGAEYKGKRVGTIGDISVFSFFPGKNLGAYGDAGAIVTDDKILSERCRMIANHGRISKYDHEFEGRNSRLDGLQAAILSVKLRHLDTWLDARRHVASQYNMELEGVGDLILPIEREWARHVYHLYVIRTSKRNELKEYLTEKGIQTGIHYPKALPKLQAYAYCEQADEDMKANQYDMQVLSLPTGDHLSPEDVSYVTNCIRAFYE